MTAPDGKITCVVLRLNRVRGDEQSTSQGLRRRKLGQKDGGCMHRQQPVSMIDRANWGNLPAPAVTIARGKWVTPLSFPHARPSAMERWPPRDLLPADRPANGTGASTNTCYCSPHRSMCVRHRAIFHLAYGLHKASTARKQ